MATIADMGRWKTLSSLAVAGAALAAAGAAQPPFLAAMPGQQLSFSVGDNVQVAVVTQEGLSSDAVELQRSPGRLRGRVGAEPLVLRLEPNRVEGAIGDDPVALDVWRSGGRLQVAGTFGQRAVTMTVGLDGIDARIAPCRYRLGLVLGHYRGTVACGGPALPVELTVPVALVARDDREIAAMLTALFAR